MNLALFDFDGTISSRDSFLLFMQYSRGLQYYRACAALAPKIILFLLKQYPNEPLKQAFLLKLYGGSAYAEVREKAAYFCQHTIPAILRPAALAALADHRQQGDQLVIVTASPRIFLEPWCTAQGLAILGTELEVDQQGRLTGRIAGANCRGEEKVRRILSAYCLDDYDDIFAYGDTRGDLPMLALAPEGKRFYKPFRH